MDLIEPKSFWFIIRVRNPKNLDQVEFVKWSNMTMEIRMKYDWYFKYRAALLQVKYPKHNVITNWGSEPASGKAKEHILNDRIKGKKATLTKYKNILQNAEKNWNSLWPIADDLYYQKALAKILRLESELDELLTNKN